MAGRSAAAALEPSSARRGIHDRTRRVAPRRGRWHRPSAAWWGGIVAAAPHAGGYPIRVLAPASGPYELAYDGAAFRGGRYGRTDRRHARRARHSRRAGRRATGGRLVIEPSHD